MRLNTSYLKDTNHIFSKIFIMFFKFCKFFLFLYHIYDEM